MVRLHNYYTLRFPGVVLRIADMSRMCDYDYMIICLYKFLPVEPHLLQLVYSG